MTMEWRKEEEDFLRNLEQTCLSLSKDYHKVFFMLKSSQARLRIPSIIIGSFTGVASFGTSTFPENYQSFVAIIVGLVNICIAILSTLETFFKIGENLNLTAAASTQLRKLANDINKELSISESDRETSGVNYLRECYTRYQQILSTAPILQPFKAYLVDKNKSAQLKKSRSIFRKFVDYVSPSSPNDASYETSCEDDKVRNQYNKLYSSAKKKGTIKKTEQNYSASCVENQVIEISKCDTPTHVIEIDEY